MSSPSRVIAFDVDEASLGILGEAFPELGLEIINGATASSLTRDWDPGTVDLFVVGVHSDVGEALDLCRFLVSCGVLARNPQDAADTEHSLPKTLGLNRSRQHRGRRPHSPLLALVSSTQKHIVPALLKAGAHSCLVLPINAKNVNSMLIHAQAGNQPGRHTLGLEKAQIEDRWQDDGGQG